MCFEALFFWNRYKYGMLFLLFQSVYLVSAFNLERINLGLHFSFTNFHSQDTKTIGQITFFFFLIKTYAESLQRYQQLNIFFFFSRSMNWAMFKSLLCWCQMISKHTRRLRWTITFSTSKYKQQFFVEGDSGSDILWSTMNSVIFQLMWLKFWWLS